MDIYLLHYNNYYNRRLRVERRTPVLSDYTPYILGGSSGVIHNVNFNPRNEIDTSVVIGSASQLWQREWGDADYLLEVDPDTSTIISRWFVVSQDRIRSGQYNLALHRDIIADNLDKIMSSPMLVEKGYVTINDPAIFNKEDMSFNQIKQSQYLLKDRTNTAWIVGYLARLDKYDAQGNPQEDSDQEISVYDTLIPDYSYTSLDKFPLDQYVTSNNQYILNEIYQFSYIRINGINGAGDKSLRFQISDQGQISTSTVDWKDTYYQIDSSGDINNDINNIFYSLYFDIYPEDSEFCAYVNNQINTKLKTEEQYLDMVSQYNNKIIFVADEAKYYKIGFKIENRQLSTIRPTIGSAWATDIDSKILKIKIPNSSGQMIHTGSSEINRTATFYSYYSKKFNVVLTEVTSNDENNALQGKISKNHRITRDTPYDIFFIPYNTSSEPDIKIITKDGTYNNDSLLSMRLAMEIARTYGSRLYDCQLLPYCPDMNKFIDNTGNINLTNTNINNGIDYSFFYKESDKLSATVLLWSSSGWFNLTITSPLQITQPKDPIEFKVERETNMYRLCSPNWNGQFEFSPLGNRGLSKFNIDCNYKPGQPYIHINPIFNKNSLYSSSYIGFNDARGLILNGDFSISMTQSSLQNYTLQNKNYQNIFDRQIENLEFNQKQETDLTKLSFATNLIQSGAGLIGSAINGSKTGIGQGLGQVGGTILGNMFGMEMLKAQQKETLDYTKDLYNMNMANISAAPNSLTRISALNNNNTIYPVLEVYSATSTEKQVLRDKIKYNGMTVNRIGNMPSFVPYKSGIETYFKGKLIRNEDIKGSYDYITALGSELNQGVFIDNKIFNI